MSWRNTITKDTAKRSWRDTIKPDPFVIQGLDGKDFDFKEHESKIFGLIKKYIDSIKNDLVINLKSDVINALKSAFKPELEKMRPLPIKGDRGEKGSEWFLYEIQPDDKEGVNGDMALAKSTGALFRKVKGKWEEQGYFGKKQQAPLMMGGVSEQFVKDYVAANGGGGGGPATYEIAQLTSNTTLTNQDVVVCKSGCTAIALKNASTATKPVVVKNRSGGQLTITVDGGSNIDDDSTWIIENNTAFNFVPQGGQYYVY